MGKKKKSKYFLFITLASVILIFMLLVGMNLMNRDMDPSPANYQDSSKPMIGVSIDAMVIERWQKDCDILKTKAEELGFRVEILNAYENADKQRQQIRSLVEEGAVAIFVIAYDKDSLEEVVKEAKKEGVIIIAYDRLIRNADVDAYVSFDNIAVGEYMAQATVKAAPMGNFVIINGSPTDNNASMFNEGYYNILQPYIDRGDIKIVKEIWADNWREEFAYDTVDQLLQDGVKIDAIIGANDRLAEGAISVLAEYGLAGKIPVVGHDADISACQRIVEGKQLMTVYKPIKNLAEGAVELVVRLLEEKDVKFTETISDGTHPVPFVKFEVIAVDATNMKETVIADFFHSEEDIYREGDGND